MDIYLDSADLKEIELYSSYGIVDGVTTNPSIIAKNGGNLKETIQKICKIIPGPVSSEVLALEASEIVSQGKIIASWAKNVYVKIPATTEGLKAVKTLSELGIHTNVTLIFTPLQALLAAKAGATLVSPFIGRLEDIQHEGMDLIANIRQIYDQYEISTKILAASIRTVNHVLESAILGADIVTVPPSLIPEMMKHPLTEAGLKKFMEDASKSEQVIG